MDRPSGACGKTGWKPGQKTEIKSSILNEVPFCEGCQSVDRWYDCQTYPCHQEFLSEEFFYPFEEGYITCWASFQKIISDCELERCGLITQVFNEIWNLINGFYRQRKDIPFRVSDVPSGLGPDCPNSIKLEWFDDIGGWLHVNFDCVPIEQGNCFPTVDKSQCQLGCAHPIESCCGLTMAECDGVITELAGLKQTMCCFLEKLDCLIEVFGQSQMDRNFVANHYKNLETVIAKTNEQITQAIIAAGQANSKTLIPSYSPQNLEISNPAENFPLGCAIPPFSNCANLPCIPSSGGVTSVTTTFQPVSAESIPNRGGTAIRHAIEAIHGPSGGESSAEHGRQQRDSTLDVIGDNPKPRHAAVPRNRRRGKSHSD